MSGDATSTDGDDNSTTRRPSTERASGPTLVRTSGAVAAGLAGTLSLFQLGLALGAPWGQAAYGGGAAELPTELRISSAVTTGVWPLIGLTVLRRAGHRVWAPLPDRALPAASWIIVALMSVAVVLNAITRSTIERAIWLPVSLLLLVSTLVVARGTGQHVADSQLRGPLEHQNSRPR